MMSNPQSELFSLLAETQLRRSHIQQVYQKHHSTIPQRQAALMGEIEQLRGQIQGVGIGADPELDDRYLQALEQYGRLDNSHEMGKRFLPDEPAPDELPEPLAKMARLGQLMLRVYGGRLHKSAEVCADLERIGVQLKQFPETSTLGDRLLNHENQ